MEENFIASNIEWANKTNLHPLAIALIIICGIAILILPRHRLIWPFAFTACFISAVQKITILELDFNIIRIMVVFGLIRFLIKPDKHKFVWHTLDKLIIYFALIKMLIYTVQMATVSAFIYQMGSMFDVIGLYFIFRKALINWKDVEESIQVFILISIPVSIFFIVESLTHYNIFSIFGGVPEITMEREGRLRCQGAFAHPIIAGCFWAALLPLTVALKWSGSRIKLIMTTATISIIIIATASSTPLFAVFIGTIGGLMFFFRSKMELVRWSILLTLIGLHFIMEAPVWHLISRVGVVGGSTSYYRYALLDGFIRNVEEWWLLGTQSTAHWCWGCFDLTNEYVLEGVKGGLLSLILFIAIISVSFSTVGNIWRRVQQDKAKLAIAWGCGIALLVHCANFIGVSYFGQIITVWYLQLAMIASIDIFTKKSLLFNNV